MILFPQEGTATDTAPELVIVPEEGIDPETGLKKEIREWLDGIAQAVSEEIQWYEADKTDAAKAAFWRQKNLLSEEKILWLRNEDIERYITSRKLSPVISGSLRIACNIRRAIERILLLDAGKKTPAPAVTNQGHFGMPEIERIWGKKRERTEEAIEQAA